MKITRKFNIVELYAGTGRSAEPFREWSRCEITGLVDNDAFARDTYLLNYPDAPYVKRDLRRVRPHELAGLVGGRVDVLLGCPPCQGFSDVGARKASDARNNHLVRFGRFAAALRPVALAMENVPLAGDDRRFTEFTTELEHAGYVWTAGIMNAALYGSTQCRYRLVLLALRSDVRLHPAIPEPTHGADQKYWHYGKCKLVRLDSDPVGVLGRAPALWRPSLAEMEVNRRGALPIPTVGQVLDGLPPVRTRAARSIGHVPFKHSVQMRRRMRRVAEGARWSGGADHFSQAYGRLHRRGLARTITTHFNNPGSGRFWHPVEGRTLTPREAARLQGFDDAFTFRAPYSVTARLIGNALDSAVATSIYEAIRAYLE